MRPALVLASSLALSACSSSVSYTENDGGVPPQACGYLTGIGATLSVTDGCPLCAVENEAAALDGNPATYATLVWPAGASGSLALRATTTTVFPGNAPAGAIISSTAESSEIATTGPSINLYLDGMPVSNPANVGGLNGVGGAGNSSPQRRTVTDGVEYDAVEIEYVRGTSAGETQIRIHEFCAD